MSEPKPTHYSMKEFLEKGPIRAVALIQDWISYIKSDGLEETHPPDESTFEVYPDGLVIHHMETYGGSSAPEYYWRPGMGDFEEYVNGW